MLNRLLDLSFLAPSFFQAVETRQLWVHSTSSCYGWGGRFVSPLSPPVMVIGDGDDGGLVVVVVVGGRFMEHQKGVARIGVVR